jgi:obg-like ATPase 1
MAASNSKKGKKGDVEEKLVLFGRPKNNLAMGIVGLPNVGKSSLFNVLGKAQSDSANFPFCTTEPHETKAFVPDKRFDWLCKHYQPKSEVRAVLTIWDIAGLVKGAAEGMDT